MPRTFFHFRRSTSSSSTVYSSNLPSLVIFLSDSLSCASFLSSLPAFPPPLVYLLLFFQTQSHSPSSLSLSPAALPPPSALFLLSFSFQSNFHGSQSTFPSHQTLPFNVPAFHSSARTCMLFTVISYTFLIFYFSIISFNRSHSSSS